MSRNAKKYAAAMGLFLALFTSTGAFAEGDEPSEDSSNPEDSVNSLEEMIIPDLEVAEEDEGDENKSSEILVKGVGGSLNALADAGQLLNQ